MALMALLAVAVMVFAYVLTSRLNAASRFVGIDREHNAQVLSRAKRALIGWMAINAAGTDDNPGRLPCPQAWGDVGSANEGRAAASCSVPAAGWLPWRTLGLQKPLDASGNQIWYVISPGWHLPNTSAINSDTPGQLALDGEVVVALLIAPGPPLAIAPNTNQLAAGCAARNQSQMLALPGTPPDPLDFLECQNGSTADNVFTASVVDNIVNPSSVVDNVVKQVFNDQVLSVTTADVIPALEAAIADRMQREIAPALKSVYGSAQWGTSAGNPLYPFAARFDNPDPGSANNYRGEYGRYQGLLPFNSSSATCVADPPCPFVSWDNAVTPTVSISGAILGSGSCTSNSSTVECTGTYLALGTVTLRMTVRANNVAMALRRLDPSSVTIKHGLGSCGSPGPGSAASAVFQSNGSADLTLQGTAPGLLGPLPLLLPLTTNFCMTADLGVLSDHPLLDPTSIGPGSTGWFVRNEWYRLVYYGAAQESTADGLPAHGCDSSNCLRFNGPRNIRALLLLAGQSLSDPAGRPNGNLADYLEYENADLDTRYEQRLARASKVGIAAINAPFNDRVILVDWDAINPPAEPGPQVVTLAPLRLATLP